jgi:membrane protein
MANPAPASDRIRTILTRLPLPGLLRSLTLLVWDTFQNFGRHRCGESAAAIAYYGLFSIFPLVIFVMSAAALFLGSAAQQDAIIQTISSYLPGSEGLIQSTVQQVMRVRGPVSLVSLVVLLWSSSSVFSVLASAVGRAWCADCGQPAWRTRALGVVIAVIAGILIILAISSGTAVQVMRHYSGLLGPEVAAALSLLGLAGYAFALVADVIAFLLLYKWVPTTHVPWRAALLGAAVAGVAFEVARNVFAWYLSTFALRSVSQVYGSVGAVLGLLLWVYFSAMIALLGAELGATSIHGPSAA